MKLKVCGMKYQDNMNDVAQLAPDFMGFIFYKKSSRHLNNEIPELPKQIKKVGVFVNATINFILEKVNIYNLDYIQLHGEESSMFCSGLKKISPELNLIKVFSIKNEFDFSLLKDYEGVCDYFLFDTKGDLPGGNGYTFEWSVLEKYPSTKPYFLSGGIGLDSLKKLQSFMKSDAAKYCYAIDVNSQFEIKPGLKNISDLTILKKQLNSTSNV